MEQPTACRPTRRRSSRQPVSTTGIRDRHALPSRTERLRRRAARLRQIGGDQPSRRPIAGGPQSSRASLDRSGSARHARRSAGTSRQSPASLRRDLRPAKLPWAFDLRALRASWRSTIRPSRLKRSQSGSRVRRSQLGGGPARSDSAGASWSGTSDIPYVDQSHPAPCQGCAIPNGPWWASRTNQRRMGILQDL